MIPKKPAPDLIRGVQWFSEKIMLKQEHDPEKACPGLDPMGANLSNFSGVMPAKAGIQ
jgi:hypothetical protein